MLGAKPLKGIQHSLLFVVAMMFTVLASAQDALDIAVLDADASLSLHPWLKYTTDRECDIARPLDINKCKRLHLLDIASANFGFSKKTYWFTADLNNSFNHERNLYFDVGYSMLDNVEIWLFAKKDNTLLYHFQTGDRFPFSQRPIDTPTFVFPLTLPADTSVQVVTKITSMSSIQAPIKLSTKEAYVKESAAGILIAGLLLGSLLIMSLHNAVVYVSLRDKSYLYFSAAIICVLLCCAILSGLAYPYLWPNAPVWNSISLIIMSNLALIGLSRFSIHFLNLEGRGKSWLNASALVSGLFVVTGIFVGMQYYRILIMLTALMVIVTPSIAYISSISTWLKGRASARFYVVAFTGYTVTVYFWVLSKFGLVSSNSLIDNSIYIAALAAILLLTLAMADRMNYERKAKHLAQTKSISALERYRDLFESSLEGMFRINSDGQIHSVNAAFAEMLGFASKQDLMNSISRLDNLIPYSPGEGRVLRRELLKTKKIRSYDVQCCRINGEMFWGTLNARLVKYVNSGNYFVEGSIIDTTERKRVEQELSYMANHDSLTGLVNRSAFEQMLSQELLNLVEAKVQHAVIFIDMDRFKLVNDTCGHIAGDKLLQQVAEIFVRNVRRPDVVARIGGDEFAIFLKNCPMEKAGEVALSIRQELGDFKFIWQENYFTLSASMGVIAVDDPSLTIKEIFRRSDNACLEAKESGRNRVVMHNEHRESLNLRKNDTQIVSVIQDAIENDEFILYQHPIVASGDDSKCYEVLLRLKHDDKILRPGAFMSAAERYNLMGQIDRWVILHFFKWLSENPEQMQSLTMASINISAVGLADKGLLEEVEQWIPLYGIDATKICFEITESVALSSISDTVKFIEAMKKLGIKFALDDFGSGYASYSYLTKLPVDFVKVDGSFVHDVDVNSINYAIVRSIVDVAHVMNLEVITEFIESEDVLNKLKEIGVDFFQGYHIAKPEPLAELTATE